jgi:hypothetical protein
MLQTYEAVVQHGNIRLPADVPDGTRVFVTIVPALLEERQARRKAALWLAENVGDACMPGSATLVQAANRRTWHFPVMLGSPFHDPRGPIGYLDVDAETGDVLATATLLDELTHNAENLGSASLSTRG